MAVGTTCSALPLLLRTHANPSREAFPTSPAQCVSPPLRAAWGLSSLLASSHSKSCLLGAHLTAKKTAAQGAMGTWPSEKSGEPGWEVGSPASRPGRAPHVSPSGSSVYHMPWSALPLCCSLASCLEPCPRSVWFYYCHLTSRCPRTVLWVAQASPSAGPRAGTRDARGHPFCFPFFPFPSSPHSCSQKERFGMTLLISR